MKTLFAFLFFIPVSQVFAQSCTDIKYKMEYMRADHFVTHIRYLYNDSAAFSYLYQPWNNPLRKATVFSKKLLHHSIFTEKNTGITYDEVNYPENNRWLITDSLRITEWQPTGISKMILNTPCAGYLRISDGGDSTLAYVSAALGDGKGFRYYNGAPGVALEVYDQTAGYHIIARSIDKMDCSFRLPDDVPQISRKEIDEQIKNR